MARKRSLGKTAALGCGGLIVLLLVLAIVGCVIIRAAGRRQSRSALSRLKASGIPTTWEQVIPPPVPDDQNAALLYEEAFAHLALSRTARDAVHRYLWATTRQERMALEREARAVLADNAQALAYAHQAAQRPKFRFNRDWSDPMPMRMPEYAHLREFRILAHLQAQLRADEGDMAGALQAWSLSVTIVKHLESDPLPLAQFTRQAMLVWAVSALPTILQDSRPKPDDCRGLADALAGLDIHRPFMRVAEMTLIYAPLDREQRGGTPQFRVGLLNTVIQGGLVKRWPRHPRIRDAAQAAFLLGYQAFRPLDDAALVRFHEQQLALVARPFRETVAEYDALVNAIPRCAYCHTRGSRSLSRMSRIRDLAITEVGLMRIGLGLAAHRTQFGAYPDALGELRTALKWEVPEDPFSGQDFLYRREGSGYVLYSLGEDLDDDGGRAEIRVRPSGRRLHPIPDRDIVFRVER